MRECPIISTEKFRASTNFLQVSRIRGHTQVRPYGNKLSIIAVRQPLLGQKKQRRLAGAAANYIKAIELFNNNLLSLSYTVAVNDSNNVDTLNRSSALGTTCCVVLNAYYLATLCNDVVNRSRIYVNAYQTPT